MHDVYRATFPIWRIVVGGLIVVGICSILCWRLGWCWWCPRCPDVDCCGGEDAAAAQIILEDVHGGVWMAMDNTAFQFNDPADPADDDHPDPKSICADSSKAFGACAANYEVGPIYRHGVLFQMGPVLEVKTGAGLTVETRYGGVYIEHDGGSAWLLPPDASATAGPDFDWLDVMDPDTKCVIDPYHAYEMVHHLAAAKISDHIAFHSDPTKTEDLAPNQCDAVSVTTDADIACQRDRAVHASLFPTRIITYWAAEGPDFYEMSAGPTTEIPIETGSGAVGPTHGKTSHVSYTFELPNKVVVDRWKDGCLEERYTGVTLIRILYHDPTLFHLGYPHKPMDGG